MLVRVGGGHKGIEAYLKTGRKLGREHTRDQLDERVILCGDLEAVGAAIRSIPSERERYLHITLSFRELGIDTEVLRSIAQEMEGFCRTAYRDDEMLFFAEAHLPKIQTLQDKSTGKSIARLAHIHVVIPKINLLTGRSLNPLGLVEHQVPFLEAFQESVNACYGLASPKEHRRTGFQGKADVLERQLGDTFTGSHKELKNQILSRLLEEGVDGPKDFELYLGQLGEVRTRNARSEKPYFNLILTGEDKGINLRDFVFSTEFLGWSVTKRRAFMADHKTQQPQQASPSRPSEPDPVYLELLRQWSAYRAREVKYMNSSRKAEWKAYMGLSEEEKMKVLAKKESEFYQKIDPIQETVTLAPDQVSVGAPPPIETPPPVHGRGDVFGQLVLEDVNRVLDRACKGRMSTARLSKSFVEFIADLENAQGVQNARRDTAAKAYEGGAKAVYDHLRTQIHWEPYQAWVYMVRHGMVQTDPARTVSREAHQELIRKFRAERERVETESSTDVQRKSRLSQLQMSLVLQQKYLWGRAQVRFQQEQARDLEFELVSDNSIRPTQLKPPKAVMPNDLFKPQDWSHRIESSGAVTYLREDKPTCQDQGARIVVAAQDEQALDVVLRLAVTKYGTHITVKGTDEFKQKIVGQAAKMNLRIVLSDPLLQSSLEQQRGLQAQTKGVEY